MLDIKLKKPRHQKILLFLIGIFFVSSCSSSPTLSLDDSTGVTSTTVITNTTNTASVNTSDTTSLEDGKLNYEQTLRQQFQELVQWQDKCYQQPKSCRVEEFTIVGTKYHQALDEQISLYAKSNINSRLGHGKREVAIESITFDDAALVAQVDACIYDTVILYMDGFIFNDRVSSSHTRWTLQLDNNRWKWINFQILHRQYNTNICQEQ
ncbi:MAG: hypothetical protein NT119_00195 [Actinobacteria bacterium]|nr:hypothetical protein [Actinomycetota bacterium]